MGVLNRLAEWAKIPYVTQGDPIRQALDALMRHRNRQALGQLDAIIHVVRVDSELDRGRLIDALLDVKLWLMGPAEHEQPTPDPTPGVTPAPPTTLPNTESVTCIVCGQALPVGGIHSCGRGQDYRPEKVA